MKLSVIYRETSPRFSVCVDEGDPAILERRMSTDDPLEVMKAAAAFVADTDKTAARPSVAALISDHNRRVVRMVEQAMEGRR